MGGFSLSPLQTVVAKPVQSWWRPFPLPHWAELCGAFWVSCKEIGAGTSGAVPQNPGFQVRGDSVLLTERRLSPSLFPDAAVGRLPEVAAEHPPSLLVAFEAALSHPLFSDSEHAT